MSGHKNNRGHRKTSKRSSARNNPITWGGFDSSSSSGSSDSGSSDSGGCSDGGGGADGGC